MKTSFLIIICTKYLLYLLDHIMQQMDIKIPLRNIVYSTGLILRGGKKHDYISILRYKEH